VLFPCRGWCFSFPFFSRCEVVVVVDSSARSFPPHGLVVPPTPSSVYVTTGFRPMASTHFYTPSDIHRSFFFPPEPPLLPLFSKFTVGVVSFSQKIHFRVLPFFTPPPSSTPQYDKTKNFPLFLTRVALIPCFFPPLLDLTPPMPP